MVDDQLDKILNDNPDYLRLSSEVADVAEYVDAMANGLSAIRNPDDGPPSAVVTNRITILQDAAAELTAMAGELRIIAENPELDVHDMMSSDEFVDREALRASLCGSKGDA